MKTIAYCRTCGRKLIGENLNRIGDNYYCHSDFSKEVEKEANLRVQIRTRQEKELLKEFENLIDTDFTNWNLIECTETDNEITT